MSENITFRFHSSYVPILQAGEYDFSVKQTVKTSDNQNESFEANTLKLHVQGPKFSLSPEMIHHTYPAGGLSGDFQADLPSIIFNRVSLPWERSPNADSYSKGTSSSMPLKEVTPNSWLMLLLLDEEDLKKVVEGEDIASLIFGIKDEHKNALVKYLQLPVSLKNECFVHKEDAHLFAYCRSEKIEGKESDNSDKAVLLCNRLPTKGKNNTVYLISLEHFKEEDKNVKYAYLYKWQFFCTGNKNYKFPNKLENEKLKSFAGQIIKGDIELDKKLSELTKIDDEIEKLKKEIEAKYQQSASFHDHLYRLPGQLGSLKFPIEKNIKLNDTLKKIVDQGGLLLKNSDEKSINIYRGPLQANPNININVQDLFDEIKIPYISSDVSYKIAFELGNQVALNDEAFHKSFYHWKQEVSTAMLSDKKDEKKRSGRNIGHLNHVGSSIKDNKDIPPIVKDKIEGWKKLTQIPYSYLIPTSKMLPEESIRIFHIDCNWINAFILGALSIGNSHESIEVDLINLYTKKEMFMNEKRWGFFINSYVVNKWRDYKVKLNSEIKPTEFLRKLVAPTIEMFLYKDTKYEDLKSLTFYLPPGATHTGFILEGENFIKKTNAKPSKEISLVLRDKLKRTINAQKLVEDLDIENNSSDFGSSMLESAPEVKFTIS